MIGQIFCPSHSKRTSQIIYFKLSQRGTTIDACHRPVSGYDVARLSLNRPKRAGSKLETSFPQKSLPCYFFFLLLFQTCCPVLMELQHLCKPLEQLLLFIVSYVFLFVWSLPVFVTSKKDTD